MYILVKNGVNRILMSQNLPMLCIIYKVWMTKPPLIILATDPGIDHSR
jgi:hypothetical protein